MQVIDSTIAIHRFDNLLHRNLRTTILQLEFAAVVRASSLKTIFVLRETLEQLERRILHDPNDRAFINLKFRILRWITELCVISESEFTVAMVNRQQYRHD